MKSSGICSICGKELAGFTCSLCGASVGISCYDPVNSVCIKCRRGRMP